MSPTADLHEPWADEHRQRDAYAFGMWIFLASEALFFGAMFFLYLVLRYQAPVELDHAAARTDLLLGGVNTALLLVASAAIASSDRLAEAGARQAARIAVLAAALLALAFLALKGLEYSHDIARGYVPGVIGMPGAETRFWSIYWLATGVHAIHVIIGLALFVRLLLMSELPYRLPSLRATALYWHLVDIVWIFLFPALYLAGRG